MPTSVQNARVSPNIWPWGFRSTQRCLLPPQQLCAFSITDLCVGALVYPWIFWLGILRFDTDSIQHSSASSSGANTARDPWDVSHYTLVGLAAKNKRVQHLWCLGLKLSLDISGNMVTCVQLGLVSPNAGTDKSLAILACSLNGVAHAARKLDATKEGANANRKNSESAG